MSTENARSVLFQALLTTGEGILIGMFYSVPRMLIHTPSSFHDYQKRHIVVFAMQITFLAFANSFVFSNRIETPKRKKRNWAGMAFVAVFTFGAIATRH
jgi:hypothetical protein